ncbi:hypothetical protein A2U01_0096666, partial [Trifolium medium]|nr:hypothetical protein [Trifolium medium]
PGDAARCASWVRKVLEASVSSASRKKVWRVARVIKVQHRMFRVTACCNDPKSSIRYLR